MVLLEKKKKKSLLQLEGAEDQAKQWDLEEIDQLTGRLSHVVYVVGDGRFHLCYLYAFHASFGGDYNTRPRHVPRTLAHGFFKDVDFWLNIFRSPEPVGCTIPAFMPPAKICMSSDASNDGIGILVGDTWDAWGLQPGSQKVARKDIGLGESLRVLLCLEMFFDLYPDVSFVKRTYLCDNDNVVKGYEKKSHANPYVNAVLICIYQLVNRHQCILQMKYVDTKHNETDPFLRGIFPPANHPRYRRWSRNNLEYTPAMRAIMILPPIDIFRTV